MSAAPQPASPVDAIPERVARLRATFDAGRTRPAAYRLAQLDRLRALLHENGDALVRALEADLRKPDPEGWVTDVGFAIGEIDIARKQLRRWMKPRRVATPLQIQPARSWIVPEPVGVVLVIAPWNYPVQLALAPLAAAIAAGNAALIKPSEVTPHVSAALAGLLPRYLDPDAYAIVEGGVAETQALLAERWDHIFYTGNGRVGRIVMAAAAKHLTPVTLELGGKSPCLVDEDVDLDVAARRIAWGKFLNCGQTCVAPDYVLVHEARERELVERLAHWVRTFYGDAPQQSPDLARIVNEQHVDRLAKLLESGTAVIGGQVDRADRYVAPTILRDVSPDSPVMQEEIFGPILPVLPVRDMEQAIGFVNARPKPLALYVFTRRQAVEEAVLERTSAGGVTVNAAIWHLANPNLPFGGVGESGMGAYHGKHGFDAMSHWKPVLKKSTRIDPKLGYPPYTKLEKALIKRFA
ncbi:MAG: aldehyde dehydrogenase family protein [Deltaproteobacteria bacterium]|nr:aldehyde dehydrogenase family protein [Deltaproteobacteria bacterium]